MHLLISINIVNVTLGFRRGTVICCNVDDGMVRDGEGESAGSGG